MGNSYCGMVTELTDAYSVDNTKDIIKEKLKLKEKNQIGTTFLKNMPYQQGRNTKYPKQASILKYFIKGLENKWSKTDFAWYDGFERYTLPKLFYPIEGEINPIGSSEIFTLIPLDKSYKFEDETKNLENHSICISTNFNDGVQRFYIIHSSIANKIINDGKNIIDYLEIELGLKLPEKEE